MSLFRRVIPTKKQPDAGKKVTPKSAPVVASNKSAEDRLGTKKGEMIDKKEVVKKKENVEKASAKMHDMPGILLRPLVTEKGTRLEQRGIYQFAVKVDANKIMIARAVESRYGIKPISVHVMHRKGKTTRFGRLSGKRVDWKKALITLPKGKSIDVHEGV